MSRKLKKSQSLAAEFLAYGHKAVSVAKHLNIRPETISRWKQDNSFNELVNNIHLNICNDVIKKQTLLISSSQDAIMSAFENKELPYEFKANLGIKCLNSHSGANTFQDRMENYYNKKINSEKKDNNILKKFLDIMQGIIMLDRFGEKLSDGEYRNKVKDIIAIENGKYKS
jgi:hypothetical protein